MTSITQLESSPAKGPWWTQLIVKYGLGAAIAIYLLWIITGAQARTLTSIEATVKAHSTAEEVHDVEAKASSSRTETYLRLLCVNTAKSDSDRNTCLSVR